MVPSMETDRATRLGPAHGGLRGVPGVDEVRRGVGVWIACARGAPSKYHCDYNHRYCRYYHYQYFGITGITVGIVSVVVIVFVIETTRARLESAEPPFTNPRVSPLTFLTKSWICYRLLDLR